MCRVRLTGFSRVGIPILAGIFVFSADRIQAGAPVAPGLSLSPGAHIVDIEWNVANLGGAGQISAYHVYRSTDPNGPYFWVWRSIAPTPGGFPDGSVTIYRDATASPAYGHSYHYKVSIVDDTGASAFTASSSAVPFHSQGHRFREDSYLSGYAPVVVPDRFELMWKDAIPASVFARGQNVYRDRVYTVSSDAIVRNYDAWTGVAGAEDQLNSKGYEPYCAPMAGVMGPEDAIYIASAGEKLTETHLYSYEPGPSLTRHWSWPVVSVKGAEIVYMDLLQSANQYVVMGVQDRYVWRLESEASGNDYDWNEDGYMPIAAAASLMNGAFVYPLLATDAANLICRYQDGSIAWTQTIPGTPLNTINTSPLAVRPDGTVVAATDTVYCMRPEDGATIWTYSGLPERVCGIAVGQDGSVFLTVSRTAHCLNGDGTLRWTVTMAATECAPPSLSENNRLIVPYVDWVTGFEMKGIMFIRTTDGAVMGHRREPVERTNALRAGSLTPQGWYYISADNGVYAYAVPPVLSLNKQVSTTLACTSQIVTYTVSWSNSSVMTAENMWIYDTLAIGTNYFSPSVSYKAPPGVTVYMSCSTDYGDSWMNFEPGPGLTPPPLLLRWLVTSVGTHSSGELSYSVQVSVTLSEGSLILNRASATHLFGSTTTLVESNEVSTTIIAPSAPTPLTGWGQNQQAYLNWGPSTSKCAPLDKYVVFRATCSTCAYVFTGEVDVAVTEYTDTGLTNGERSWYRVRARNIGGGLGAYSVTASGEPLTSNVNPPSCLNATQQGASNKVTVEWCPSNPGDHPPTGYAVYRTTFAATPLGLDALKVLGASTTYFVDVVPASGTYYWHARAVGSLSDPSPLSGPVIVDGTPPTTPANLVATGQVAQIELTWEPSTKGTYEISGYFIYRGTYAGGESPAYIAQVFGLYATSYVDAAVVPVTTYFYTVNAFDDLTPVPNESGASNEAAAKAMPAAAAAPGIWIEQWQPLRNYTAPAYFLNDVHFPGAKGSKVGYAVGDVVGPLAAALKTEDGGLTWQSLGVKGANVDLHAVYFTNTYTGVVGGGDGAGNFIWRTTDGGASWNQTLSGVNRIRDIEFVTPTVGFAAGGAANVYRTNDGGQTWVVQPTGASGSFEGIATREANLGVYHVWASGGKSEVRKSTDGGGSWVFIAMGTAGNDVHFTNTNTGWLVGAGVNNDRTVDGGDPGEWVVMVVGGATKLGVHFTNTISGWVTGLKSGPADGIIKRTTDSGVTWADENIRYYLSDIPENRSFMRVRFIDNGYGWTVGENGIIMRRTQDVPPFKINDLAALPGDGQVSLSWSTAKKGTFPLSGYTVYRSTSVGTCFGRIGRTYSSLKNEFTDTTVVNGTLYFYVVRAYDTDGLESANSNEVVSLPTLGADNPPSSPSGLITKDMDTQVRLRWKPSTPGSFLVSGYAVFRGTFSGFTMGAPTLAGVTTTIFDENGPTYLDTGRTNGEFYYYRVAAFDNDDPINWSLGSGEARALPFRPPLPDIVWWEGPWTEFPHYGHGCAELNGYIYAVGSRQFHMEAERYHPGLRAWERVGDINWMRGGGAFDAANIKGALYLFESSNIQQNVELFDEPSKSWQNTAAIIGSDHRFNYDGDVWNDVYYEFGGGGGGGYEFRVASFRDLPLGYTVENPSPRAWRNYGAVTFGDRIYLFGGDGAGLTDRVEAYNPPLDAWSIREPMLAARTRLRGIKAGGLAVAMGGDGAGGLVEAYDPKRDVWYGGFTPVPASVYNHGIAMSAGKIYVTGGDTTTGYLAEGRILEARSGDGEIELQWEYQTTGTWPIAEFRVWRATWPGGQNFFGPPAYTVPSTTTAMADSGVINGNYYYYVVEAEDTEGNISPRSPEVSTFAAAAPSMPGPPAVSDYGDSWVEVQWGASSPGTNPVGGYEVYRKEGVSSFELAGRIYGAFATTYVDGDLNNGTSYTYYVRAFDTQPAPFAPMYGADSAQTSGTPAVPPLLGLEWSYRASLLNARKMFAMGLINERIYVAGGVGLLTNELATVEEYDPWTDTWRFRNNAGFTPRGSPAGAVYGGELYTMGGDLPGFPSATTIVESYDPASDTWTPRARIPLLRVQSQQGAATLSSSIYLFGGNGFPGGEWLDVYDPGTDTWKPGANAPNMRSYPVVLSYDDRLWALGGSASIDDYDVFEPISGLWSSYPDNLKVSDPFDHSDAYGGCAWGDKIVLAGGTWGGPPSAAVDIYDPRGHTMRQTGYLNVARGIAGMVTTAVGKVYAVGGDLNMDPSRTVEMGRSLILQGAGSGKIDVRWVHAKGTYDIATYEIFRATYTGGGQLYSLLPAETTLSVPPFLNSSSTYTDTNLTNGQMYYYQVRITDTNARSVVSNEEWLAPATPPDAPTTLTALMIGSRFIAIAWAPPVFGGDLGVTGYNVYRSTSATGPFDKIGTTTATAFIDSPITNGIDIYYAVTAFDSADPPNASAFSATLSGEAFEPPAPYVVVWRVMPSLQQARYGHGLGGFGGEYLYAYGGNWGGGLLGSVERINLFDQQGWKTLSPGGVPFAREYFGFGQKASQFYIVGGLSGGAPIANMQMFDPSTTSWSDVATSGFVPVEDFPMLVNPLLGNFCAFNGFDGGSARELIQYLGPNGSNWINLSPFPPWPTLRKNAGAVSGLSMFVYGGNMFGSPTDTHNEYLPWRGERVYRSGLFPAREGHAGAALEYRPYAMGGDNAGPLTEVREYNPATDSWVNRRALPEARVDARAINMNRKIYLVGGAFSLGGGASTSVYEGTPMEAVKGDNVVDLQWGFDQGTYALQDYTIYRCTYVPSSESGRGPPFAGPFAPGTTTFNDGTARNGNAYFYYVDAQDIENHVTYVWDMANLPATAPTNLTAAAGNESIVLDWAPIATPEEENVVAYMIYRATYAGVAPPGTWWTSNWIASVPEAQRTYTDTGLTNGTEYFYAVRAYSMITGGGNPSNEVSETPFLINPPSVPQNLLAAAGLDQTMRLTWDGSTAGGRPLSGYLIYRTTTGGSIPSVTGDIIGGLVMPSNTVFIDQSASAAYGNTYEYSVVAFDDWTPATKSAESNTSAGIANGGYWRFPRADVQGTGRSQLANGLVNSLGLRWAVGLNGTVYCTPAVAVASGDIYFTTSRTSGAGGELWCLAENSGVNWIDPLGAPAYGTESSPAIAYADDIGTVFRIYAGIQTPTGGGVVAYAPGGLPLWTGDMTAPVRSSPMVLPDGGVVVGDDNGIVRAFGPADVTRWSVTLSAAVRGPITLLNENEGGEMMVGVLCDDGKLYGIMALSGIVAGSIDLGATPTGAVIDSVRDYIYVTTLQGDLIGVSMTTTGAGPPAIAWSFNVGGGFEGAPAYNTVAGWFVAANSDGNVYGVDVNSGPPVAAPTVMPIGAASRSSIAIAAGGRKYVGAEDGRLYEILNSVVNSSVAIPNSRAFGLASPSLWETGGRTVVFAGGENAMMHAFADAPAVPTSLTATAMPGAIDLSWNAAAAGWFPVGNYEVYRATCSTCPYGLIGTSGVVTYTDTAAGAGNEYHYQVRAVDNSVYANPGLMSGTIAIMSGSPCAPGVTLKLKNPIPLYVNVGEDQLWRISFSNASVQTAFNVVITTQANSFTDREFIPGSYSATLTGAAAITATAHSVNLSGPWAVGMPPALQGDPLFLRWVIPELRPGESGEISYRTDTLGPVVETVLSTYASATMSCDAGLLTESGLTYSVTTEGKRIAPPIAWMNVYVRDVSADQTANGVAIVPAGDIYTAGYENRDGIGQSDNWSLVKLDSTGALLWSTNYNSPADGSDVAYGVAIDGFNRPVVVGSEDRAADLGQGNNWFIRTYTAGGAEAWSTSYDGPVSGGDVAVAVRGGPSFGVFVLGREDMGAHDDWRTRVYNSFTGGLVTTSSVDVGGGDDGGTGVAYDSNNDWVYTGYYTGGNRNWVVAKYSSGGALLWTKLYAGADGLDDMPTAVAVDPNDNVIAVGYETTVAEGANWVVRKYDPDGNLIWMRTFNGASNGNDIARSVAVDADGNVYVAGMTDQSGAGESDNWLVIKWDNAGNLLGSQSHDGIISGVDDLQGIAVVPSTQDVVVAGSEQVRDEQMNFAVARINADAAGLAALLAPSIPSGLTATACSTQVGLQWNTSIADPTRSISGYKVFRQTVAGVLATSQAWFATVFGSSSSTFVDTATTAGKQVFYRVLAFDDQGAESGLSMESSAIPTSLGITATKMQIPGVPGIGEPVTYRIVVTNVGLATLTSVKVVDTVSPVIVGATTYAPSGFAAPTITQVAGGTRYEWSASGLTMTPGLSFTFTIAGMVGEVCSPVTVTNTAWASGGDACGVEFATTNITEFSVVPAAVALTVTKTRMPATPAIGDPVMYVIVVSNVGAATITDLTVTDTLSPVIVGATTFAPAVMGGASVSQASPSGTLFAWGASGLSFAPGTSFTFTITGFAGEVCGVTAVGNTAFISGGTACSTTALATQRVQLQVTPPSAGFFAQKEQSPAAPQTGDAVTYRVVVINVGTATLTSLTVVDTISPLIAGAVADEPVAMGPPAVTSSAGAGTLYVWSQTGLSFSPGATYTFTITGTIGEVCVQTGITNTAFVEVGTACSSFGFETNSVVADVAPPLTALAVVKEQSPASPATGGSVTYRIHVTNAGTATIEDLVVTDTVSSAIAGIATDEPGIMGAPTATSVASGTLYVWDAAGIGLAPGATYTFTISGQVGEVCGAANVSNTGFVIGSSVCTATSMITNVTGFQVAAPVLNVVALKEQDPAAAGIGEAITYRVIVINAGQATIEDLMVTDTISPVIVGAITDEPIGMGAPTVNSVGGIGTVYEWSATGIKMYPGTAYTFTISGAVGNLCVGADVSNTAVVAAASACDAATLQTNGVGMRVEPHVNMISTSRIQIPASPGVGSPVTYQLTLLNTGTATITDLIVTDTVSPVIVNVTTDAPPTMGGVTVTNVAAGTLYAWSAAGISFTPWTAYTFTISGQVGNVCTATAVSNTWYFDADVACGAMNGTAAPSGFSLPGTVLSVNVIKEQEPASPSVGQPITYRIVVTNAGTVTISAISVLDTVSPVIVNQTYDAPPVFSIISVSTVPGGTHYIWTGGMSMAPGMSYTITITGQVGVVCAATDVSNTAFVLGYSACTSTNMVTNAVGFSVPGPVLSMNAVKEQVPAAAGIGEPVLYRIIVTNTGDVTVENLTVVDTVSAVIVNAAADEPAAMGAPTVTSVGGAGTLYEWTAAGLSFYPGTSYTFTLSGQVGLVCSTSHVSNTAIVSGGMSCAQMSLQTSAVKMKVGFAPVVLLFTKEQVPASPVVGDPVTYRIVVTNAGAATVEDFMVTDTVSPVIVNTVTDEPGAFGAPTITDVTGGTLYVWSAAGLNMVPGTVYTFTISGQVGAVCLATQVSNTAWSKLTTACITAPGQTTPVGFFLPAPNLNVAVVKEQDPASAGVGEPVTYRIVVTNTGDVTVTDLTVVDTVSPVVTGIATDAPAAMGAAFVSQQATGTRYIWSQAGLSFYPGTSWTFTIAGSVGSLCSIAQVSNTALAEYGTSCATKTGQSNPVGMPIGPPTTGLTIVKEQAPASPGVGQPVTYRIVVTNLGTATIEDLTVTDTISSVIVNASTDEPVGFTPTITSVGSGTLYEWSQTGLTFYPGTNYTFTITGQVGVVCAATDVSNTALAIGASECASAAPLSNVTGFSVPGPVLSVGVVKEQSPVNPGIGEPVSYRVIVTNTGDVTVENLTVTDTVLPVIVNVATDGPVGFTPTVTDIGSGTLYEWSAGPITFYPGTSYTFTITGQVGVVCGNATIGNTAVAEASTACSVVTQQSNAVGFDVTGPITNLAVSKQQTPVSPSVGQPVSYRIVVTNAGTATIEDLAVTDTILPVIVNAVTDEPGGFTATITDVGSGTLYEWGRAGLTFYPGVSYTFTITGQVGSVCTATDVSNSAFVIGASACTATNMVTNATGFTVPGPTLSVVAVKEQVPATAGIGEPVLYRIIVTNTGDVTVENLTVVDTVSPVLVGQATDEPGTMGVPAIMNVAGGTRYEWSQSGLTFYPGTSYTFTVTGQIGLTCAAVSVSNTAVVEASTSCAATSAQTNVVGMEVSAPIAALAVQKTQSPANPGIGESVTYRLVVTNVGTATVDAFLINDTVSPVIVNVSTDQALPFLAANVGASGGGSVYEWDMGGLNMTPGMSFTFTIAGQVGNVCAPVSASNTAYVRSLGACAQLETSSNVTGFDVAPALTSLAVLKQQVPASPAVGQPVTYRVIVTNVGTATITDLIVTDTISPVVVNATADEPGAFGAPTVTSLGGTGTRYAWSQTGLSMVPGTTYTFTITGQVGAVCGPTAASNTGFVTGASDCASVLLVTNATGFSVPGPTLSVSAVKEQVPAAAGIGEPVLYRVIITNTGDATIESLTVVDTVSPTIVNEAADEPAAMGVPTVTSVGGTGTVYEWSASGLTFYPGTSYTFTISGQVDIVCGTTDVSNTAVVEAATSCAGTTAQTNAVGMRVEAASVSVLVAKNQIPANPGVGAAVTYQIVVVNTGTATVPDLKVTDTVSPVIVNVTTDAPAGMGAVTVTQAASGTIYGWEATGLSFTPGMVYTFTVAGQVGGVCAATAVSNTGFVVFQTDCVGMQTATNATGFSLPGPTLNLAAVKEQVPTNPGIGEPVLYRIIVINTGGVTVENLTVTDTIAPLIVSDTSDEPAAMGVPTVTSQAGVGTRYEWSASGPGLNFYPGMTYTFTVTGLIGNVCGSTSVSNTAVVQGGNSCSQTAVQTNVTGFAVNPHVTALSAVKSQVPAAPGTGDPVTYRIVVVNTGSATIDALTVSDTIAAEIVNVSAGEPAGFGAPSVTSIGSGTLYEWSAASLNMTPGTVYTFTLTGQVGVVAAVTSVSNTAVAAGSSVCATAIQQTNVTGFTIVPAVTNLAVAKAQVPAAPGVGEAVTYRIVVVNTGSDTITDLTVTDTISPVIAGETPDQPAAFGVPIVSGTVGGTLYVWSQSGLTMSPGMAYTFTLSGSVGSVCGLTAVNNEAFVQGSGASGSTMMETNATGFSVAGVAMSIAASKIQTPISGSDRSDGDPIAYTIVVVNTGAATVENLTVVDTVSPMFVAASNDQPAAMSAPTVTSVAGFGTRYVWSASGLNLTPGMAYTFTISGNAGVYCAATTVRNRGAVVARNACQNAGSVSNEVDFLFPAPGVLEVAASVPSSVALGQAFDVTMTVTNTGGRAVASVLPGMMVGPGAGLVNGPSAPIPSGPLPLAAGANLTFRWSFTATGGGAVGFSATGSGTTCAGTSVVGDSAVVGTTVQSPAVLAASASISTTIVAVGQTFQFFLTVTNTGGSPTNAFALSAVAPSSTAASLVGGPAPAPPIILGGGASQTFAWTFLAAGSGTVDFTATASGIDSVTLNPISDGDTSGPVGVFRGANLVGAIAPSTTDLIEGQALTLTLTITNTGETAANGVIPSVVFVPVAGLTILTGPSPVSANIGPAGASQTYSWTVSATAGAVVAITGGAAGTEEISGGAVSVVGIVAPSNIRVRAPAQISITSLTLSPATIPVGDLTVATLVLTNGGDVDATVNPLLITEDNLPAFGAASPQVPGGVLALGASSSILIVWTYTGAACGTGTTSARINGAEAGTGRALGPITATSNPAAINGVPAGITALATKTDARVGTGVDLAFTVIDSCGLPVPGVGVSIVVVAPSDAAVTSSSGTTDANGQVVTQAVMSANPGTNAIRGDLASGGVPGATVYVEGTVPDVPTPYLSKNFFNPKRGEKVGVRIMVPQSIEVSVRVYNVGGELVREVNRETVPAGLTVWEWDGRNHNGAMVGNGTYFIQILAGKDTQIKRVIVLKR